MRILSNILFNCVILMALALVAVGQTPAQAPAGPVPSSGRGVAANQSDASWKHGAVDKPGMDSSALREDPVNGAFDVFARYPAGYVFPTHWHSSNERMVVIEGRMQIEQGGKEKFLDPGGFAFLPAREIQKMSCVSKTRCVLYMFWDAAYDSHKAP